MHARQEPQWRFWRSSQSKWASPLGMCAAGGHSDAGSGRRQWPEHLSSPGGQLYGGKGGAGLGGGGDVHQLKSYV